MSSTWNQFWLVFSLFHPGSISEGYWTCELPVIQSIMVCLQKQILYTIRVLFMKMELLINRVFFRASWYKHYSGNKPYMYFSFQFMLWFPYHHRFKMPLEYRIFSLQLQEYFAAEKLLWAYGKRGILRGLMDIFFFARESVFQSDSPHSIHLFMEEAQLHHVLKDVCNAAKEWQFMVFKFFLWARSRRLRLPLKLHFPDHMKFCLNAVQPKFMKKNKAETKKG